MPRAEDLMPAEDLPAAGFEVTNVDTDNGSVVYYATRDSVGWAVSLEVTEPGPELGQSWAETLEYVRVVAEPGEQVEQVTGVGEDAVYWESQLFVRAGPVLITIEAEREVPDPATSRLLCEWLARRVLARLTPAAFHQGAVQPPPPPAALTRPAPDLVDQRTSDADDVRRLEESTEWLNRQIVKSLERDQKWLRYRIGKSGASPDPELVEALAEVDSALAAARTPARVLAPAAPDHPLTSGWSMVIPGRQRKLLLRRWKDLVPGRSTIGQELIRRYDTPREHGFFEILMALPLLDANADAADDPAAVELAVWFHAAGGNTPSGAPDVEAAVREAWQRLRAAGVHESRVTEVIRLLRLQGTDLVPDTDRNGSLLSNVLLCFLRTDFDGTSGR